MCHVTKRSNLIGPKIADKQTYIDTNFLLLLYRFQTCNLHKFLKGVTKTGRPWQTMADPWQTMSDHGRLDLGGVFRPF